MDSLLSLSDIVTAETHADLLLGLPKPWHIELSDRSAAKKTDDGYQGKGCPCWITSGLILYMIQTSKHIPKKTWWVFWVNPLLKTQPKTYHMPFARKQLQSYKLTSMVQFLWPTMCCNFMSCSCPRCTDMVCVNEESQFYLPPTQMNPIIT